MPAEHHPIGNSWLQAKYNLNAFKLTHLSYIGPRLKQEVKEGTTVEIYPSTYSVEEVPLKHIEFSLKYDDLNLDFLKNVFFRLPEVELVDFISAKPKGVYHRRIGYLYEMLSGNKLPLDDIGKINYINLLDPEHYVTGKIEKIQRWGINDNLLGKAAYCPIIRKTEALRQALDHDFGKLIEAVANQFPVDVFNRAVNFLYSKETRSSYQIEKEEPSPDRMNKFIRILEKAGDETRSQLLKEENLTRFQNEIVDPRFAATGFREYQNFVARTGANFKQIYEYICPPPEFVRSMMTGLIDMANKCDEQHPVVQAAAVAFGFVFIHPFEDGNGRIHRFLIHDILTRTELVKKGMIIPVSAHMLNHIHDYDLILERYSRPLMKRITFVENNDQSVTITNPGDVEGYFRYPDLTEQCLYLALTIKATISEDIFQEMEFLVKYDEVKSAFQSIVDLPDRQLNLLIKLLHQNKGMLARRKRGEFEKLTDEEIDAMEKAFQTIFGLPG